MANQYVLEEIKLTDRITLKLIRERWDGMDQDYWHTFLDGANGMHIYRDVESAVIHGIARASNTEGMVDAARKLLGVGVAKTVEQPA